MDIKFDFLNKRRNPSLILCNPNGEELYSLAMAKNREISISLNEISELTFELSKYKNSEEITPYYDLIKTKRIIKVEDFGQFIITNVEISSDGITEVKQVTCKGLEFELSSKNLDILEGTYALYNPTDTEKSLLHILIGYIPTWSIQEVDSELWSTWRTFDIKDNNIFNFLMEEVQIAFDCVFIFDTFNRRIKVVKTSNLLKTTDIYLSNRNLMKELNISENADNITTALTVYGDGDLSIRTVNPLGTATIYDFSFFATEEWMTKELIVAVNLWQQKIKNAETTYANKLVAIKNLTNELDTLKNELVNLEIEKKALEQKHSLAVVAGDNANCTIYSNQIKAKDVEISSKKTQIGAKENEITQTQSELTAITKGLSFESNFTKDQLKELSNFIYQSSTQNTNYSTTDLTTIEEQRQIMYDLYNWGKEQLSKSCQPIWEFEVDSINFLNLIEYKDTINQLDLGCEITIEVNKHNDLYAKAILIGYTLNLDDFTELELKFSSVLNYSSSTYTFDELFNTTASISKSFDFESPSWSMGKEAYSKINEYINSALDLTNQGIISSDNQEFTMTNVGIRGRELDPQTKAYKPEQIWINKNTIAFSDDGFNTTKSALGKVTLPDGTKGYGLIADYIVGRVLCGQKLILENEKSTFRVDGDKVYIKNADIVVTSDTGKESTLEDALKYASENGGSTAYYQSTPPSNPREGDIWYDTSNGNKPKVYINNMWKDASDADIAKLYEKANGIASDLASNISQVYEDMSQMEQAIKDGEIVIFYQNTKPLIPPAKLGDMWYDTTLVNGVKKNEAWLVIQQNGNLVWEKIKDAEVTKALADASTAQATADGKIKSYYQTTAPTNMTTKDYGDLWFDTSNYNRPYRWDGSKWVDIHDTMVDQVSSDLSNALVGVYEDMSEMQQAIKDGEIIIYYQGTSPTSPKEGDLWYDTANKNKAYVYKNGGWKSIQDQTVVDALQQAQNAQTTADGKIKTYYQTTAPSGLTTKDFGDLWFDTDDSNHLYRWDGSKWVDVQDKKIDEISSDLASNISQVYKDMDSMKQAIQDGEIVIFYQSTKPSSPPAKEGDLWYDTANKNKAYLFTSNTWKSIQDQTVVDALKNAQSAQATADSKIKTYWQTTTPTNMSPTDVGDLWIDTGNKNKLYRYNGSSWVSVQDGTIAEISTKVDSVIDSSGNLIASKMVGQILTGKSNIVCASATTTGNVLTLNENGIIVATRNSDGTINTSGAMTCITKDGIVADAIKSGGTIQGITLKGSTIYGGDLAGVYSKISSADPLAVYRPTGKVAELWGAIDGSSYLNLYERSGTQKYRIASGANATSITTIRDTGSIETIADKLISFNGYEGFKVYAWNRTDPYIEIYRNFIGVGHPSAETYIDGSTVYINGVAKGITLSELEVANMELQAENQELALKQSELEVTLMEKGVL